MFFRNRLVKELKDLQHNEQSYKIYADEQDIQTWYAFLFGPQDSPFKDGIFKLKVSISSDYPMKAPLIHFQTRIFHPNVHFETGEVCLEVLKEQWNPQWTIESLIKAIWVLLQDPNPNSPLNCDAGNLLRANDIAGYKSLAQYYCQKYGILKTDYHNLMGPTQDPIQKKLQ